METKKITLQKEVKSKKKDLFISVEQVKELYSQINDMMTGFVVWLEQ
jgi:hypothetical protein